MWKRILEIVKKEFIQVLRDPRMRVVLFVPAIVETIIFGYAINMDIEHVQIAWMDQDHTPAARDLRAAFDGSPYFTITHTITREEEIKALLDHGTVKGVIRVLPGFNRDISRNSTGGIQILIDGTDSNTASIVAGYMNQVVRRYSEGLFNIQQAKRLIAMMEKRDEPARINLPDLRIHDRIWFNPELKSRDYFVTGVIVNIIALVTVMLTAMAIVREKEIGTMEQLMVTPIRPIELIIGKTLPFALIGLIDVLLITVVARLVFFIPFRGSCLVLILSSALFLLTSLGVGLFISTISQTQQQAMMTTFFFMLPSIMLSGFAFPIRNMPVPVQYLTYLDPLRYYMVILRNLFLKGTGIDILWPEMLGLLILGLMVMGFSILRFHKRLD